MKIAVERGSYIQEESTPVVSETQARAPQTRLNDYPMTKMQPTTLPNSEAAPARHWHQVAQEITTERDPQRISALVQELGRLLGTTLDPDLQGDT